MSRQDTAYPKKLGDKFAPERLYAIGNLDLLMRPSIGLCGSRDASPQALGWARRFGRESANKGVVIVSGYARGIDLEAHLGVLEAGGSTIAVLPQGINHFGVRRELKPLLNDGGNFLALSMFEPDAVWAVWRAMERNKLIVGLSAGLCVIEAREKGGTINAAYESIRQHKPLWAFAYADNPPGRAGNRKLLAASALPLAKVEDFREALDQAMREPPSEVRQLVMAAIQDDDPKEA